MNFKELNLYMSSIVAGGLIAVGAIVNLQIGGVIGAILFSFGLLMILMQGLDLFTGKVGYALDGSIRWQKLAVMLLGNAYGVIMTACALSLTPLGVALVPAATAIIASRISVGLLANTILGIGCGVCVYLAVDNWANTHDWMGVILPVSVFVICGFGHCIADMFYATLSNAGLEGWLTVLATGIGNVLGSWIIPIINKQKNPSI